VVIYEGRGGLVKEHIVRFQAIAITTAQVEIRGPCWSACTLVTSFIPKARLCFGAGSFLAFHMAKVIKTNTASVTGTYAVYAGYPSDIQDWIDHKGGWLKLPTPESRAYWTLRDRDLWAMGYSRCK
jgi:hypothetical protein